MKKLFIFGALILLVLVLIAADAEMSCMSYEGDAEYQQKKQTEKLLLEVNSQLGLPNITNYQEKKLAKMIFELRDQENLITYAYIVNINGSLIFLGKCVGFGLPYSVQYTNPEKRIRNYSATIPQADPNGLYMPQGLSATWLMMIDSNGEARPVYIEPEIIVSPFRLH